VAAAVARELGAPLDVIVVSKVGVPGQPELAMAAVAEGGVHVLEPRVIRAAGVGQQALTSAIAAESAVVEARVARLRHLLPQRDLTQATAVVVDDGMATGATARAACLAARRRGAAYVVLAVPVAARDTVDRFTEADEVVCVLCPSDFHYVGRYYRDFSPTPDEEVSRILAVATA